MTEVAKEASLVRFAFLHCLFLVFYPHSLCLSFEDGRPPPLLGLLVNVHSLLGGGGGEKTTLTNLIESY